MFGSNGQTKLQRLWHLRYTGSGFQNDIQTHFNIQAKQVQQDGQIGLTKERAQARKGKKG
jgi:hypothetical protein